MGEIPQKAHDAFGMRGEAVTVFRRPERQMHLAGARLLPYD